MKKILTLAMMALCIGFYSCDNDKDEHEDDFNVEKVKAEIQASNVVYSEAFAKRDSLTWLNCYSKDAKLFTPNGPTFSGHSEISNFYSGSLQMGLTGLNLTANEVMGNEDGVLETGNYELFIADGTKVDNGKYVVYWKKEDGKWKMHRDMFNSDVALAAPAK